ncbi:NAD-dependent epimerase/dehydratase family protein [Aliihoeflea aestuarii]|jgi:nucleoside-diphosphate-sugar epimerase|uniref:NAD-dependent epimerase/dehydratase family protein n=1 Tax=Aliihoeflea aestuarii TaxID=453840 RepID=UPI002095EE24|nr:NAD-dependent epimerase/dehydratase family protein [Aliihoeflea aestuarii]MCO6393189.1 NAD-dependent epimerase/dehydratase family protein [Aliihoeflea aestuarii]
MRVLIIGGTRFIGAHVARQLSEKGAALTAFHRGRSSNAILPEMEHMLDSRAEYPIVHFPEELRRDWDVVVHMVAMGQADAQAAIETFEGRTGRLILISSCDVYRAYGRLTKTEPGAAEPLPLDEDAPLRSVLYPYRGMEEQLGAYAHDYEKILAENALRAAGLDWTILRLPKVYGPEDNGDLATVYNFATVPVWKWTHGHVTNVAAAIAHAATHPAARNEVFNVGEEATPSMGERLALLPERKDAPPEPPPFDYGQSLVLDTTRIRRMLGYADIVDETQAMRRSAEAAA